MNKTIIVVDRFDHGFGGLRYKNIEDAIEHGAYSVWTKERMRAFNRNAKDQLEHFLKHVKNNNQVWISEKRFFGIVENTKDKQRHIDFYNECITQKWD